MNIASATQKDLFFCVFLKIFFCCSCNNHMMMLILLIVQFQTWNDVCGSCIVAAVAIADDDVVEDIAAL